MFQKKERETDLSGLSEMGFLTLRFSFASSPFQVRSLEWEVNGSHMGLTWEEEGSKKKMSAVGAVLIVGIALPALTILYWHSYNSPYRCRT